MTFDVAGKRILVTGASSGLGSAMAVGLAERGAIVGMCARRADRLAEVLDVVRASSPDSRAWVVDLADLDAVESLAADMIAELGGLDVLVDNAGIPKRRWAWEHRPDEVASVLRVNLESPIRLTLALLPALAPAPSFDPSVEALWCGGGRGRPSSHHKTPKVRRHRGGGGNSSGAARAAGRRGRARSRPWVSG